MRPELHQTATHTATSTPSSLQSYSRKSMERALRVLNPLRRVISPMVLGMENVPNERPLLFVGNHTILGIFDIPLMLAELYEKKGIILRALGDHIHFKIPLWGEFLGRCGAVDGTRENCARLMQEGECILVFPGGAREVAKRKGEKYKLMWKERLGFARMAVQHGCTIVPFAAIGIEDSLDILLDADEILASPLGPLLTRLGARHDVILPLVRGIGPTPLPRPERLYFYFAPPIATQEYEGAYEDTERCQELRDRVRAAVLGGIELLVEKRDADAERNLLPRVLGSLRRRAAAVFGRPGSSAR